MALAPARLSITTCCPMRSERPLPAMRPIKSTPPPAGNGTMIRIGLLGYAWGDAVTGQKTVTASASSLMNTLGFICSSRHVEARASIRRASGRVFPVAESGAGGKTQPEHFRQDGKKLVIVRELAARDGPAAVEDELAVAEPVAHLGRRQLHGKRPHEPRIRVCRGVMIRRLEINRELRLERELVQVRPRTIPRRLQRPFS